MLAFLKTNNLEEAEKKFKQIQRINDEDILTYIANLYLYVP